MGMEPNTILAFDLYTGFDFPALDKLDHTIEPDEYKIKCLTYNPELGASILGLRGSLNQHALDAIGGRSIARLESDLKYYQEKFNKTRLRYVINPLARGKKGSERKISLFYFTPLLGLAADILVGYSFPIMTLSLSAASISQTEIWRRSERSEYKDKITEAQERLQDPKTMFYSNLSEVANHLNVDTTFVENAQKFVDRFKEFEFLVTDSKKVMDNVSGKLRSMYYEFIRLERSL